MGKKKKTSRRLKAKLDQLRAAKYGLVEGKQANGVKSGTLPPRSMSHQHPLNHSRADDDKASSDKQRAITNPFEVHRNASTKHTVLGRRVRGAERNVALARSRVTTATTHNQPQLTGASLAHYCNDGADVCRHKIVARRPYCTSIGLMAVRTASMTGMVHSLAFASVEWRLFMPCWHAYARRRFGEGVAEMTEEEKRLGRLVKARAKQAKKASVFNLDSSAADGSSAGGGVQHELTHFGRVPAPALC